MAIKQTGTEDIIKEALAITLLVSAPSLEIPDESALKTARPTAISPAPGVDQFVERALKKKLCLESCLRVIQGLVKIARQDQSFHGAN